MAEEKSVENVAIPELGGLTLAELRQKSKEIEGAIASLQQILSFPLHRYTAEDRQLYAKQAAFQEGEKEAFNAILAGADHAPQYVRSLSDKDEGADADLLETNLMRARVLAYEELQPTTINLLNLASDFRDTAVYSGYLGKSLIPQIYGALKALSETDPALKGVIAVAIDNNRQRASGLRKAKKP
jgi:hypothetical protein